MNKVIPLSRMRTLDECYNELKALDPDTAVSKYFIRQLAISGKIPCIQAGRKRLINFDKLIDYLSGNNQAQETQTSSGIKAVKV